jgi:glyoxylase-like metal-dependent hydrolase (beta-lactamase superfamily II)
MKQWMKPEMNYTDIITADNRVVPIAESRGFLASIGLSGEFVHTPGHSDDSVSIVLDSGEAFTGDLTAPGFAPEESVDVVERSWQALRDRGATKFYGGHGPVR